MNYVKVKWTIEAIDGETEIPVSSPLEDEVDAFAYAVDYIAMAEGHNFLPNPDITDVEQLWKESGI